MQVVLGGGVAIIATRSTSAPQAAKTGRRPHFLTENELFLTQEMSRTAQEALQTSDKPSINDSDFYVRF
ncbi:MAG TPA: hypothetical protein VFK82_09150 [Burkholderiaceae bacterium]|nr:hypothetical protein [Burkholderiaceae bacterium]